MDQPEKSASRKEASGRLVAMLCMFAGAFMQQLDSTIVNVALPHMQGSLQASPEQITWVLTSYIVATALLTAPAAWISARIGRKTLFQICVAGFSIASVFCGLAQTLGQIVLFRFIQGAMGASLIPVVFAIMLDNYEGPTRNRMLSLFSLMSILGMIIGPTLGGYITEVADWRWTFFINLPMGAAIMIGTGLLFHDRADTRRSTKFDGFGFVSLSIAVAAFQLMLDRGPSLDWFASAEIITEAVVAVVAFYIFVIHLMTSDVHFIPPALFRDRNFMLGTSLATLNVSLVFASAAVLPAYLQSLGKYSVFETGVLLSPRGVGAIFSAFIGARLFGVVNHRILLLIGWALAAWSLWQMAHWTPDIAASSLVVVSFTQGLAMAGMGAVTSLVAFTTLPKALSNDGTGGHMLIRNIGAAALISTSVTFLANSARSQHEIVGSQITPFNRALHDGAASLFWNPDLPFGALQLDQVVTRSASIVAYSNLFLFLFYVSCAIPLLAFLLRVPAREMRPPPTSEIAEL